MGGITMWIILGSLVGIVATFLIVASILDRKKVKKQKIKKAEEDKKIKLSRGEVYLWLSIVIKFNNEALKNFVPSVGDIKMSNIRNKAKEAIDVLKKDVCYKLASEDDESEDVIKLVDKFIYTNSNIWPNKLKEEIKELKKFIKGLTKSDYEEFIKNIEQKIKGIYK